MNRELYEYRDSTSKYLTAVFIRNFMKKHDITLEHAKEMMNIIHGETKR